MKYTTAKTIMKIYRREGRFGKKKQRMKKGLVKTIGDLKSTKEGIENQATHHTGEEHGFFSADQGSPLLILNEKAKMNESMINKAFWGEQMAAHFGN